MYNNRSKTPGTNSPHTKKDEGVRLATSVLGSSIKQRSSYRTATCGKFAESAHSKKANISQVEANRAVKNYLSGK